MALKPFGKQCSLDVEPYTLGKWQLLPIIDRIGSSTHVRFPGIRARLASAPGFLLAAERTADLGSGGPDIDVGDPAVRACRLHESLGFANVAGKDRRCEPGSDRV